MVAAAQCGKHNEKRSSFGHSLVVDPWGEVILVTVSSVFQSIVTGEIYSVTEINRIEDMEENIGVGYCDLDLEKINKVRTSMPVMDHFKYDIYQ